MHFILCNFHNLFYKTYLQLKIMADEVEMIEETARIRKDAVGNILVNKDGNVTCISEGIKILFI